MYETIQDQVIGIKPRIKVEVKLEIEREHPIKQELREAREYNSYCKQQYLWLKGRADEKRVKEALEAWQVSKSLLRFKQIERRKLRVF